MLLQEQKLLNRKTVINFLFFFAFASYLKFFYLLPLPGSFGKRVNQIIPMLIICCFLVSFIYDLLVWNIRDFFYGYLLCFFFFLMLEIVYTTVKYPSEPILNSIKETTTYINLFSYCIFIKIAKKNYNYFLKKIVNSCTFVAALFILQSFLFNTAGIKLISVVGFSYGELLLDYRNGIRLIAADLITFIGMLSIGFYYAYDSKKEKRRYLFNIIVVLIYEIYSSQTRSSLLGFVSVFVLTSLLIGAKNKKRKLFFSFILIICLIISSSFVIGFFGKIYTSIIDKTDYSMYHRIAAYAYFLSIIPESPLFGIGLLNNEPSIKSYWHIVHGPFIHAGYGYSDVGFIGTIGKLGIIGGIFYLIPMLKCIKRYKQNIDIQKDTVNFVIFLIAAFSMINLSFFDAERIMLYPILMTISEMEYMKIKGIRNG